MTRRWTRVSAIYDFILSARCLLCRHEGARRPARTSFGREVTDDTTRIVAINKPRGVLTARRRDPTSPELPTVIELLLSSGLADAERFSHVGRLDVASEGLLLLTTDGQLTARMIDPAHGCRKTYLAVARGRGRPGSRARIHAGASCGRTRALTHTRTHGANTAPALQPATPSDQARAPRACAMACFSTLTRRRPTWQG